MRGRARGNQERIIILAHQVEVMARQKNLRAVKHYLSKAQESVNAGGAADVLAMFKRVAARGGSDKQTG